MSDVKPPTVTLVGHCGPDSSFLRMAVTGAVPGAQVKMADTDDQLARAIEGGSDLLMFNRVLESGFDDSDGVALLAKVKRDHPQQRALMVSNYPEAQEAAEAAGATPGFGKNDIGSDKARQRIRDALGVAA